MRDRPLGEAFAVTAMGAGDFVGDPQHRARARRRGFLADRDVRRAAVVEIADRLVGARTQLDDHLLEFADDHHILEHRNRLSGVDRSGSQLRLEIALVAIGRNFAAIDLERIKPGRMSLR